MSLTGSFVILAGWLMIMPLQRKDGRRPRRYLLGFLGTSLLTLGMATVIQGRF
jgi:hypothetical protein